jgi:hypothetical protein
MPNAGISIDVNEKPIPWIKVKKPGGYRIEFVNRHATDNIEVTFSGPLRAPDNVNQNFIVAAGGGNRRGFDITASAGNGFYPFSAVGGGGGGGNGGIEIDR